VYQPTRITWAIAHVVSTGFHGHRRSRALHSSGFDAPCWQPDGLQALRKPRRHRPGFETKTLDHHTNRLRPSRYRLGFSLCLALSEYLAGVIDDADGRFSSDTSRPAKYAAISSE
jgi:hypothetical protein